MQVVVERYISVIEMDMISLWGFRVESRELEFQSLGVGAWRTWA